MVKSVTPEAGSRRNTTENTFDTNDTQRVRHTKLGAWDLYQEINPQIKHIPGSNKFEQYVQTINALPYVWKMLKDLGSLKDCQFLLCILSVLQVAVSLVPALSLWRVFPHLSVHFPF